MERLTHKARFWARYKAKRNVPQWKCIDRLGQYEDTGLTPEQIREIDQLYSEKCREVTEYQKMLGVAAGRRQDIDAKEK